MSIIKNIRLKPIFNKPPREKPLAGNFGGRKPLIIDQGIDHLVIDMKKLRDFFSGEKLFFLDTVHLCSFPLKILNGEQSTQDLSFYLSLARLNTNNNQN
jgi:hypothetical protein